MQYLLHVFVDVGPTIVMEDPEVRNYGYFSIPRRKTRPSELN